MNDNDQNTDDGVTSPPLRQASSATASSNNSFNTSVKSTIIRQNQHLFTGCFVCLVPVYDIAHLLPRTLSRDLIDSYTSGGLLRHVSNGSTSPLAHPDNGIPLCPTCHRLFDKPNPEFVLLPRHLSFFIDFEKRNLTARQARWDASGEKISRLCPSKEEYWAYSATAARSAIASANGVYDVYYIRNCGPQSLHIRSCNPTSMNYGTGRTPQEWTGRPWGGSPVLMILNAVRALQDFRVRPEMWPVFKHLEDLWRLWRNEPWHQPRKILGHEKRRGQSEEQDDKGLDTAPDKPPKGGRKTGRGSQGPQAKERPSGGGAQNKAPPTGGRKKTVDHQLHRHSLHFQDTRNWEFPQLTSSSTNTAANNTSVFNFPVARNTNHVRAHQSTLAAKTMSLSPSTATPPSRNSPPVNVWGSLEPAPNGSPQAYPIWGPNSSSQDKMAWKGQVERLIAAAATDVGRARRGI